MGNRERHADIRGTASEAALLVLVEWSEDTPTVNDLRDELGVREGTEAYAELTELGYLESEVSLAAEAVLTTRGRALAAYILSARDRGGPERNDAVRRGLLRFLAEHPSIGACSAFTGMPGSEAFGAAFLPEEIDEAADWLRDHGLIESFGSFQQSHLRPKILPAGREVLHVSDVSLDDYLRSREKGGVMNDYRNYGNSVHGNVGAIQQGDHNTAHVSQVINENHRRLVLSKVAEIETDLANANNPELTAQVAAIREEAERPQPTKEGLLAKVGLAFATALATEGGQAVVVGLQQLVQTITG
jgi:hypothetical protein